jgi:hypothetical protein
MARFTLSVAAEHVFLCSSGRQLSESAFRTESLVQQFEESGRDFLESNFLEGPVF